MIVQASFEDFLYIALGLVWVIYSAYSAKKKKEAKNNPASVKKSKSFIETVISEMGYTAEQTAPVTESTPDNTSYIDDDFEEEVAPYEEPEKIFSYDDEYEESNYNPASNVIETPLVDIDDEPIVEVSSNICPKEDAYIIKSKSRKKIIDLRKAVIYSVILKKVNF